MHKKVKPKTVAITFVITLVFVALVFVVLGNRRHMGFEVPVWPAVDTRTGPGIATPALCGEPGARMPSTGFPFSDEVFDDAQCSAGRNYLAILLNGVTVVPVTLLLTVLLLWLPKRKKHE